MVNVPQIAADAIVPALPLVLGALCELLDLSAAARRNFQRCVGLLAHALAPPRRNFGMRGRDLRRVFLSLCRAPQHAGELAPSELSPVQYVGGVNLRRKTSALADALDKPIDYGKQIDARECARVILQAALGQSGRRKALSR